ncbi:MAG TPA: hypothetical protein VNG94_04150 [Pyrinomonadaceae bacterium]|nr:hypothetical protein [Pyrinomonadaceae bacterium]
MQTISITKNAKLQKDDEGLFWLSIESSVGEATFALSIFNANATKNISFDDVLEAFMKEQQTPATDSLN